MSNTKKTLLLIDVHTIFLEGLTSLFQDTHFEVIGSFTNPIEALQEYKNLNPDIIIISECMSSMNTLTLVQELLLYDKYAKIMVLASSLKPFMVIESIKTGVKGYISRSNNFNILKNALVKIYNGQAYFCDQVSQILADNLLSRTDNNPYKNSIDNLTNREKEIMFALLSGLSIKSIAISLNISTKTVASHKSNIYRKFNISNAIDLIKIGTELGF